MSASKCQQFRDFHTVPIHSFLLGFIRFDNTRARLLRRLLSTNCHWLLVLTVFLLSVAGDASCNSKRTCAGGEMESAFESWIGQAVVVQLTLGRIKLTLRGTLLKDRSETLLVRPDAGSEVEIPKTNVLAIEEAGRRCTACRTFAL
jgi:hypothetical protein